MTIASHDGRVEVAETIDLRPLEEADVDPAPLEIEVEYVVHRADAQRICHEGRIADRDRQSLRDRPDCARLVEQHEIRSVPSPREIAREVGETDSHEHDFAVVQLARCLAHHELLRRVVHLVSPQNP
jgi:hypothetical protein